MTVLASEKYPPYAQIALPYLLTGTVEEKLLFLPMPSGVNIVLGDGVSEVNPRNQEARTASGRKFSYDKLLIATGAVPVRPAQQEVCENRVLWISEIIYDRLLSSLHVKSNTASISPAG